MNELSENIEDYLKAIYLISKKNRGGWVSNLEISEFLRIKPSSVSNMLYKLNKKDLIDWSPRKSLRLTIKGKKKAKILLKYNNLLFQFFKSILKIDNKKIIKQLCCEIEHHITPEVSNALKDLIFELT